jgi:hypothetical protein
MMEDIFSQADANVVSNGVSVTIHKYSDIYKNIGNHANTGPFLVIITDGL